MVRHSYTKLVYNLPQLQNLIKRDPESYRDEFLTQHENFHQMLEVFKLAPDKFNKDVHERVMFCAQVAHCYPDILSNYPEELLNILETHNTVLDSNMRLTFCRALILLRSKNLLAPTDLLTMFFRLLQCKDKNLRTFLKTHIVNDIKNQNSKHKDVRLNTTLQNFMYNMLQDSNSKSAKLSVDVMIELYKKNVWNDAKTVNVVASACFSKVTKVMVAALKFFIGTDPDEKTSDDSDSDNEPTAKEVAMANKVNKKTRKREKNLKKEMKQITKAKKKKSRGLPFNFSALHLVHDPQDFAEKLFHQLESTNERFEVKLLTLDVISRLIGVHQLLVLNFYPYIQRFMQPHQREVVRIMQFAAQASHELVPPDVLEPVLRTLVNNFVTERNSSDVMAIGLNAVRELCSRCPMVMTTDLLNDLVQYKHYRERSVMMAARSLVHLYRSSVPELLHKKHRGRPTEASIELKVKQYGEIDAKDYVPGADVLLKEGNENNGDDDGDDNSEHSSDSEWEDVEHSSEGDSDDEEEVKQDENQVEGSSETIEKDNPDKIEKAKEISVMRILTDEDFHKIDTELLRKEISTSRKGKKRPAEPESESKGELVKLGDIENIYKKRKHDKQARIEAVRKGQEDRVKRGFMDRRQNPLCSKTNREKRKNKNFMMLKHKVRSKIKRSFKDKQIALRNHLLKLKKFQ